MKKLHMMIGIPGSGKTVFARKLAEQLNCPLISLSILRDVKIQKQEDELLIEGLNLCLKNLNLKDEIVYDARNITIDERKTFINAIKEQEKDIEIIAYLMNTPVEECIKRIIYRNDVSDGRFFPPELVRQHNKQFLYPKETEYNELNIIKS